MRSWIGTITAALSAVMLTVLLPGSVQAAAVTLPSGSSPDEVRSAIEALAEEKTYASFETAVFCGYDTLYTGCFGETDCENHIAADEESVYDWGSITKTLTWVSALQLYEEGKLDLNADVRTYLPAGFIRHAKYDDPITMLNLMNHNAGWCETTYDYFVYDESDLDDLGTMLQKIEPAQVARPGEVMAYSNYGAGLAGYVIECVSGESYVDYVQHHIFEPLGMEHTSIAPDFGDNTWVRSRREKLESYVTDMEGKLMPGGTSLAYIMPYPAGSACGTTGDLVKYGQALVDKTAPLFHDPGTQAMIFEGSSFYGHTDVPLCGYGFWMEQHKTMTFCHDGATLSCISNLVFDPVSGVGVVVMSNTRSATDITMGIPKIVFGEAAPEDFPASEITDHKDISGNYFASRTYKKGIQKFMGYASMMPVSKTGEDSFTMGGMELSRIGNDLYLLYENYSDSYVLVSGKTLADGSYALQLYSEDYVQNDAGVVFLVLMVFYLLTMVVTVILLLIKLIQTIIRKRPLYTGSGMITLAQVGKLLTLVTTIIVFMTVRSGVVRPFGILFAVANMLCAVLCLLAIGSDIRTMASDVYGKAKAGKYVFNILVNGIFVAAVLLLETYRFWGC